MPPSPLSPLLSLPGGSNPRAEGVGGARLQSYPRNESPQKGVGGIPDPGGDFGEQSTAVPPGPSSPWPGVRPAALPYPGQSFTAPLPRTPGTAGSCG